jgi:hypothetical protein
VAAVSTVITGTAGPAARPLRYDTPPGGRRRRRPAAMGRAREQGIRSLTANGKSAAFIPFKLTRVKGKKPGLTPELLKRKLKFLEVVA